MSQWLPASSTAKILILYPPCYPLHKVLTFLLSRSDSLQVYTLAMQVRGVERQQRCCFHHHRCHHLQTGHGAWREKGDSISRGDRGRRDSTIAEVAIDASEHVRRKVHGAPKEKPVSQAMNHLSFWVVPIQLPFWSKVKCLGFGHSSLMFYKYKKKREMD